MDVLNDNPRVSQPGFSFPAGEFRELHEAFAMMDVLVRWAVVRARRKGLNPDDEFRGLYMADADVDELLSLSLGEYIWAQMPPDYVDEAQWWMNEIADVRTWWWQQIETRLPDLKQPADRLSQLVANFELSQEETELLLLALAPELDPRYGQIFGYLQDDVTRKTPSAGLLFNLRATHFSEKLNMFQLLGPNSTLVQHHLVELGSEPLFLQKSVCVPFHIIRFLLTEEALDARLVATGQLLSLSAVAWHNAYEHPLQDKLMQAHLAQPLLLAFTGPDDDGKLAVARQLAAQSCQSLLKVDLAALKTDGRSWAEGLGLVLRDGRLHGAILYLTNWQTRLENGRAPSQALAALLRYPHTVILVSETNWARMHDEHQRPIFSVHFPIPSYEERLRLWQQQTERYEGLALTAIANQFRFTSGQIADAWATARDMAKWDNTPPQTEHLFAACRAQSNQNLVQLATKITPRYTWDAIILPVDTKQQLQELVNTVRSRPTVYKVWGFDRKLALGKGLSALFAGESGTGKTMAADIMAHELGLDLYKVDLSTLVSKYIGETEKNLDRIFTEAATSNAILFFDEADAIFGKRSEVKDSHDRYANIEISYLLQRMEAYDGVVILATNLRANLDEAFTRRLHFVIEFPFPESADRERIWRVNFPPETPIAADINWALLADRYQLTGGNIRNIILAAAFLAAAAETPVGMSHLIHATRREYQKMGRLLDEDLFQLSV